MKKHVLLRASLVLALSTFSSVHAQERAPELIGLEKTAEEFVVAYNKKDAAAIAALFAPDGELCDVNGEDLVSGRDEIKAHYAEIFAEKDAPSVALEVDSVRLVAPNLAIEDGTAHFTPPGENAPPRSSDYTAVLLKTESGTWQIASTRTLRDATGAAGQLADLESVLKGEWTTMRDGLRLDLAFGWDESGKFLSGEMLTTTADSKPQPGTIRIGWDAAKKSIVSWMFDAEGGASFGIWTPTDEGWVIRTEGTTGDGETMTANQELTTEGKDVLLWSVTNKVLNGEKQPDNVLRIVRQTPDPSN